jgi:hypothetical protein
MTEPVCMHRPTNDQDTESSICGKTPVRKINLYIAEGHHVEVYLCSEHADSWETAPSIYTRTKASKPVITPYRPPFNYRRSVN